jgi:hypothetical protein
MAVEYLKGGEAPTAARMTALFQELDRKIGIATGKRSLLMLRQPGVTAADQPYRSFLGDTFIFSNRPAAELSWAPPGRIYNHADYTDAAAAVEANTDDPDHIDNTNHTLGVKLVDQVYYDRIGQARDGMFFNGSIGTHWRMMADLAGVQRRYYLRERVPFYARVYNEPQRHRRYSVADLVFEDTGDAFDIPAEWDKYCFFRLHNLNPFPLQVNFLGWGVKVVPWGSVCVRRHPYPTPGGYETCGNYFFWFRAGDPRMYDTGNCRLVGMRANNVVNPRLMFSLIASVGSVLDLRVDPHEQQDETAYLGPVYGLAEGIKDDTIIGDLLVHPGKLYLFVSTAGVVAHQLELDRFSSAPANLSQQGLICSENAAGDLQVQYVGAGTGDLWAMSSNLFTGVTSPWGEENENLDLSAPRPLRNVNQAVVFGLPEYFRYFYTHGPGFVAAPFDPPVGATVSLEGRWQLEWVGTKNTAWLKLHMATVGQFRRLQVNGAKEYGDAPTDFSQYKAQEMRFTPFGLALTWEKHFSWAPAFENAAVAPGIMPTWGVPVDDHMRWAASWDIVDGQLVQRHLVRFAYWGYSSPVNGRMTCTPAHPYVYGWARLMGSSGHTHEYQHSDFTQDLGVGAYSGGPKDAMVSKDGGDILQHGITGTELTEIRGAMTLSPPVAPGLLWDGTGRQVFEDPGMAIIPIHRNPDASFQIWRSLDNPSWYSANRGKLLGGAFYGEGDAYLPFLRPRTDHLQYNMMAQRVNSLKKAKGCVFGTIPFRLADGRWFYPAPNAVGIAGSVRPAGQYASFGRDSDMYRFCQSHGIRIRGEADFPGSWQTCKTAPVKQMEITFLKDGGYKKEIRVVGQVFPTYLSSAFSAFTGSGPAVFNLGDYFWCAAADMQAFAESQGQVFVHQVCVVPLVLKAFDYTRLIDQVGDLPGLRRSDERGPIVRLTYADFITADPGEVEWWADPRVYRVANMTRACPATVYNYWPEVAWTLAMDDLELQKRFEREQHAEQLALSSMEPVRQDIFRPHTHPGLLFVETTTSQMSVGFEHVALPSRSSKILYRPAQWVGYQGNGVPVLEIAVMAVRGTTGGTTWPAGSVATELRDCPAAGRCVDVTEAETVIEPGSGVPDGQELTEDSASHLAFDLLIRPDAMFDLG